MAIGNRVSNEDPGREGLLGKAKGHRLLRNFPTFKEHLSIIYIFVPHPFNFACC